MPRPLVFGEITLAEAEAIIRGELIPEPMQDAPEVPAIPPLGWQLLGFIIERIVVMFPELGMLYDPGKELDWLIVVVRQSLEHQQTKGVPLTWEQICRKEKWLRNINDSSRNWLFPFDLTGLDGLDQRMWARLGDLMFLVDALQKTRPLSQSDPLWRQLARLGRVGEQYVVGGGINPFVR